MTITRDITRDMEEATQSKKTKKRYCHLYVYFTIVIATILAHEASLVYSQRNVRSAQGEHNISDLMIGCIPSLAAVVVSLAYLTLQFFRKWPKVPDEVQLIYGIAFVFGLFHTIQVIIYLFIDIMIYRDIFPYEPMCAFGPPDNNSVITYDCYLPKMGRLKLLSVITKNDTDDTTIGSLHELVSNNSHVLEIPGNIINSEQPIFAILKKVHANSANHFDFENIVGHLKMMIVLLQSAVLVALLRFPLWIMLNNIQVDMALDAKLSRMPRKSRLLKHLSIATFVPPIRDSRISPRQQSLFDLPDDRDQQMSENEEEITVEVQVVKDSPADQIEAQSDTRPSSTTFPDAVTAVLRTLRLERQRSHNAWLLRNASDREKWTNYAYSIELCYFCFVEVVDAFSLLEEVVENVDFFKVNDALTYSTLFFIATTLMISTAANFLSSHPFRSKRINRLGRFIVVLSNNLPFFILRCYMFYIFGGLQSHRRQVGSVFLLFALKELIILALATFELVVFWLSGE